MKSAHGNKSNSRKELPMKSIGLSSSCSAPVPAAEETPDFIWGEVVSCWLQPRSIALSLDCQLHSVSVDSTLWKWAHSSYYPLFPMFNSNEGVLFPLLRLNLNIFKWGLKFLFLFNRVCMDILRYKMNLFLFIFVGNILPLAKLLIFTFYTSTTKKCFPTYLQADVRS